ncbi:HYR domain-containing protein [Altibacter sp.]|uniref:HYR domain-containing protein n=1 Tax=Altibacter sp. TaxID=2024823 RepID=UPI000C96948F|nr:HYR domain-containing protein [Altibacter sp.]MAP54771.1 hypothetical protein [Altibacter sp.]
MKKIFTLLFMLTLSLSFGQVLNETFDDATGFTTSSGFFSDGTGDYFGLAVADDWGAGTTPTQLKAYTGFTGAFLTGMDLDGEGATLPIVIDWTGLDITGLGSLTFNGEFAEFFDTPGDIDPNDFIIVQYQIDGGGYQNLIAFEGADFSTSVNGIFREDTNFDGEGDGAALGDAAANFMKMIPGAGTTLDLRMTVSVDSGDEDFAVDNFVITGTPTSDTTPPVITCPTDIMMDNDAGICGAIVTFADATATDDTDPSPSVTQTAGPASGSEFPVGDTVIEFTATDASGNSSTCTFTITVNDVEGPMISCPLDITVDNDPGLCEAVVNYAIPTATDNCPQPPTPGTLGTLFTGGNGSFGNMFDINALSNVVINSFDVNMDNGAVLDVDVYAKVGTWAGSEDTPGDWTLIGTATGVVSNGDGVPTPLNLSLNYSIPLGETHAFYVTPTNGTTGQGFNYTNGTTTGAVFASDANIEFLEGAAKAFPWTGTTFAPRIFNGNIIYETGGLNVQLVSGLGTGATFPVGTTTETYEVTDASGNTSTCSFDVTVEDVEAPVIMCPADQTVTADASGTYTVPDYLGDGIATVTENCTADPTVVQSPSPGTMVTAGTTSVSIIVTDDAGNQAVCVFNLMVEPSLGVDDVALANVSMFPNPASGTVRVNTAVENISIFNVLGQKVLVSTSNTFDVSNLPSGSYLVEITAEAGTATKQLIVE